MEIKQARNQKQRELSERALAIKTAQEGAEKAANTDRSMLRPEAAAAYLGLAPQTLARWRCEGPPFIRAGRAILYDPADLSAWLAANRFASTSEADNAAA